jgi:hypothetical protein
VYTLVHDGPTEPAYRHGTDAVVAEKALLCGVLGHSSKTVGGERKLTLISCVDDLLRQDLPG